MNVRARWPEIREIKSGARRGWQNHAKCKGIKPHCFEAKFGESGIPERAKRVACNHCAVCPVLADCSIEADAALEPGLRGGEWREIHDSKPRYRKELLIPADTLLEALRDLVQERAS